MIDELKQKIYSKEALTFDDVLLKPRFSNVLPHQADIQTQLTRKMKLRLPILSSAMDTVTEAKMAIAMAQNGGLGVIHRNFSPADQAAQVKSVKKFESGMVFNPVTIAPDATLEDALNLMRQHHISGIPVVSQENVEKAGRLVGILTHRDVRFATDKSQPVRELMTKDRLITVRNTVTQEEAKRILHQFRIEKLLVVDDEFHCIGLITVKDMEKKVTYPNATVDQESRLCVAAAIGPGKDVMERVKRLLEEECDVLVIDTAHGHSQRVFDLVSHIRGLSSDVQLIVGNIATAEGARSLCDLGVETLKVGIGPGSICTTRIIAGVGVPQLTAIMDVANAAESYGAFVVADGGIKYSGDFAKALAAGAHAVMLGSLLAGTDESPGETFLWQGRTYKSYRGMGSVGAMIQGSADRYGQDKIEDALKLVPEGIEGQIPCRGPVTGILGQLSGGVRAAMGYVGAGTLAEFRERAEFVRMTGAGLRESHVHDVKITRESPNYPTA